jgi:hypothetical protein
MAFFSCLMHAESENEKGRTCLLLKRWIKKGKKMKYEKREASKD